MSFRKEGLCTCMSPGACIDTKLHRFTKPRTHFYSCPESGLLAGTDFTYTICSAGVGSVEPQVDTAPVIISDASNAQVLAQRDAFTS